MGKRSLKKNAFYNILRTMLSVVFPLVTYQHITTVLGDVNFGKVNYTISIVTYFMLLAIFGMGTYAIKECAPLSGDKEALNDRASRLFTFNIYTSLIAFTLLMILIFSVKALHPYTVLLLIQSIQIIFSMINVEWVNVVFEDYKFATIRIFIIDIIILIALFAFVRKSDDYYIYAIITIISYAAMAVSNMLYCRRYVSLKFVRGIEFWDHIKKGLPFFINDFSIAVYVGADTTMIGAMKGGDYGDHLVGIYSIAVKIYTVVKNIFVAIFSVTVYRLTECIAKKDYDQYYKVLGGVTSYFILLAFPAVTGMIAYADYIVRIFGEDFAESAVSLRILAIALLFAVFGGIATRCINVPLGYEVVNTKVTLFVALENVLLNFPIIYLFNEKGAAFTTALAEFTALLLCVIKLKREHLKFPGIINFRYIRDAIMGCVWIFVTYMLVGRIEAFYLVKMLIGIALSVAGYVAVLLIMRNEIFIDIIKSKLKR